jgi:hypothetical protein
MAELADTIAAARKEAQGGEAQVVYKQGERHGFLELARWNREGWYEKTGVSFHCVIEGDRQAGRWVA